MVKYRTKAPPNLTKHSPVGVRTSPPDPSGDLDTSTQLNIHQNLEFSRNHNLQVMSQFGQFCHLL